MGTTWETTGSGGGPGNDRTARLRRPQAGFPLMGLAHRQNYRAFRGRRASGRHNHSSPCSEMAIEAPSSFLSNKPRVPFFHLQRPPRPSGRSTCRAKPVERVASRLHLAALDQSLNRVRLGYRLGFPASL